MENIDDPMKLFIDQKRKQGRNSLVQVQYTDILDDMERNMKNI